MRTLLILTAATVFVVSAGISFAAAGEPAVQYIDDAAITAKVKAALLAEQLLKAMKIGVETDHGVVQLTGTVDTSDQEAEAIKTANRIDGVKSVKDFITVRNIQEQ